MGQIDINSWMIESIIAKGVPDRGRSKNDLIDLHLLMLEG